MYFHFHLILKTALLNHRLREANAPTVSYSDKSRFHDYNVITCSRGVNPYSDEDYFVASPRFSLQTQGYSSDFGRYLHYRAKVEIVDLESPQRSSTPATPTDGIVEVVRAEGRDKNDFD